MAYKFNNAVTADRLRELLNYDPMSGVLSWRTTTNSRRIMGRVAGSLTNKGYISMRVDNVPYQAHRLAWLHTHGRWPAEEIDHINGNRSDNRIVNLREASRTLNARNLKKPRGYHPTVYGKFRACLIVNYRKVYLGTFETAEEARAAYLAGRRLHFGEYGSEAQSVQNKRCMKAD